MQPTKIAVIGIDLGKNSCSLAALDDKAAVVKRRRMRPDSIVAFAQNLPPCTIAMEACCGASPGPAVGEAGSRGPADVAGIRAAVREGAEER